MPPRPKNTNKKKKGKNQSSHRTEAAVSCAFCAHPVSRNADGVIECICTRVLFCSESCQEQAFSSKTHDCPGPPEATVDLSQRLREIQGSDVFRNNPEQRRLFDEEYRRTVTEPMTRFLLSQRGLLARDLTVKEYASFADQGNVAFAYLAGVHYKNRMVGKMTFRGRNNRELVSDARGQEQISVLATDELAVKYLRQAAEAGHGLAMQSLADLYESGKGVRKSHMMCLEWLWQASLQHSAGGLATLDTKNIIAREIDATSGMIEQMRSSYGPGLSFSAGGPNIGSLMVVLYPELAADNYTLPAFASTTPTLCVGGSPHQGTTGLLQIIAANEMKELVSQIASTERRGNPITSVYGRRGIAKEATVQTYGEATRSLDSVLFVVPPAPACDETPTDNEISDWTAAASRYNQYGCPEGMKVCCVHSEGAERGRSLTVCRPCIIDARERLSAVASGSVVLSLQEVLQSRGRTAIWRRPDGTLQSETHKNYGRGEVECALAALVASKKYRDAKLAHPLFVAQDPNFFWPLIFSHGCIRAALEYVAPHLDWNERLGPVNPSLEQVPVIDSCDTPIKPWSILRKCGSDRCLKLEPDLKVGDFSLCGRCQRRSYCSKECAKDDWIIHKRECKAAAAGSTPTAQPAAPKTKKPVRTKSEDTGPASGDEVVVHSLVARPEFNGCVGVIYGDVTDGRYPVKLPSRDSKIAIKPMNFHRLGAFVAERANKASKFECLEHASEICSKCNLDFGIVNHLTTLSSAGRPLNLESIEYAAEVHFATVKRAEMDEISCEVDRDFPMECQGLQSTDIRFILKALLETKPKSLLVAATTAGMASFSGRATPVVRPYVITHLESFLSIYNTGKDRATAAG